MPKKYRLKAGQFQYKAIIFQFSDYIYKFDSSKPVDSQYRHNKMIILNI